jgi:hypothetical protein
VLACGWLAKFVAVVVFVEVVVAVVSVVVGIVLVGVVLVGVVLVDVVVGVLVGVVVGVALESPITCAEACSSSPVAVKPHGGRLSPSREDDDSCGSVCEPVTAAL